jgi:hypothetical protein
MVWPILISVSVTPGALAAFAAHDATQTTAPALDCRSERRDSITLTLPHPQRLGGIGNCVETCAIWT